MQLIALPDFPHCPPFFYFIPSYITQESIPKPILVLKKCVTGEKLPFPRIVDRSLRRRRGVYDADVEFTTRPKGETK